jgi:uncharacterized protein (DUF1015 family)
MLFPQSGAASYLFRRIFMAVFRPFRAVRPTQELASKVAALPYDVMSSEEAYEMAKDNPYSFLHVDKAEIDLPEEIDQYDQKVYDKAAENLQNMIQKGVFVRDSAPSYFIYRQIMGNHAQAGIVGCASIDDYLNSVIKKHELTVAAKEADRIRHVDTCNANTGPIFLTFRENETLEALMKRVMDQEAPLYDFTSEDEIRHTVWKISDSKDLKSIEAGFGEVPCLYIADGHHRAASAVKVGLKRREEHPDYTGAEEFNYFLAVAFPSSELKIWDYNRVVKDLNGLSDEEFLKETEEYFEVQKVTSQPGKSEEELSAVKPSEKHTFSMYLHGTWYKLHAKEKAWNAEDTVSTLDVSILQNHLLAPVLGIGDPRTDSRISFVGGIRGLRELVKLVGRGDAVAFALYPTSIQELMQIADEGKIMPPKSTWFEPKLRSGLFIHELS